MKKHSIIFYILLIIIAGCTSDNGVTPLSPGSYGRLAGTVVDEAGNSVSGASVATNPESSTNVTDGNGAFNLTKVAPGKYIVIAKKAGYSDGTAEGNVAAGYPSYVKIVMKKQSGENRPPVKPFNPNPPNQSAIQQTAFNLTWECSDPDGDEIHYDVYFGMTNPPAYLIAENSQNPSALVSNLEIGKPVYWRVVAKDAKGAVTEGDVWQFMVTQGGDNNPPVKPFNPFPKNNSTINYTTTTLSWDCSDPDGDAIKYDVYLSSKLVASDVNEKTYNPGNLVYEYTYTWQIVAKDSKGAKTYGDVWSFKVERKNQAPAKASNPNPANNSTITNTRPTLSWDCSDADNDTIFYDVCFGDGQGYWTVVSANQKGRTYLPPTPLAKGQKFYWKIISKDAYGAVTDGDMWAFTVAQDNRPPVKPSNPNPFVGQMVTKSSYNFTWDCSDPDGDALNYDFYIRKENGDWIIQSNLLYKNYQMTGLVDNMKYYWKVVAKDSRGMSSESPEWYFVTRFDTVKLFDKIIAYYPFNGNVNDESGDRLNGQNKGVSFAADRKGNPIACAFWDRADEYVEFPYPQQFHFKGDFTIAMWIKPNKQLCSSIETHIDVIVKTDMNKSWTAFGITQQLGLEFWIDNNYIGYDFISLKDMQWNHIAVVGIKDGQTGFCTASLYLNGVKLGESKRLPMPTNYTNNLRIGERPDNNSSFGGWIDELYFFNRALGESEILNLAK